MSRGGGGGSGLLEALVELAVGIVLLFVILYWTYWAWVHYWGWIVGGALAIGGVLVFIRWVRSRDSGW